MIKLRQHLAPILAAINSITLVLQPIPFCFDCEGDNPWNHTQSYNLRGDILFYWIAVTIFLAGILRLRLGWIVPATSILALMLTQHMGGVPWWDVWNNEAPAILIFFMPFAAFLFAASYAIGLLFAVVKSKLSPNAAS